MSPTSYRAAPPRIDEEKYTNNPPIHKAFKSIESTGFKNFKHSDIASNPSAT